MLYKARLEVLVVLLLCLAVLAACQSDALTVTRLVQVEKEVTTQIEVTRVVVQTREVEATRLVEVTPTPTPIPTGGYVVTALAADAVTFNPLLAADDTSRFVGALLYGGMLATDPFSGQLECHFCQSWQMAGRTWTFVLRDDLSWSDGEPITVDDFLYTYTALLWAAANESLDTPKLKLVQGIESIAKVDEQTVSVTMKDASCQALADLSLGWLPQHLYGPEWDANRGPVTATGPFGDADDPDLAGVVSSGLNTAPSVSSGPFLFREWVPGDRITLVRNPGYFKGTGYLDGLVVRIVPEEATRVQMLRAGELDVLENLEPRFLTEIELMEGLVAYKVLDDSYVYLGFQLGDPNNPQPRWLEDETTGAMALNEAHGEHPILGDQRVRQAIAYAVDRNAVIRQIALGQGYPLPANMLPSLEWAYNSELEPYPHDPERAAVLLDEAGWTLNESTGVREKDGRPLRLDLQTNMSSETRVQIGELIEQQLEAVGFEVDYEAMEWGAFVGLLLGQQFDLVIISWTNLGNNPDDSLFFGSANDTPGLGFNFASYYNPTLDGLWRDAAAVPGCRPDDRSALYRRIQTTLYQELPYYWLYVPLRLTGASKRLVGIDPGPWGTWYNVESWYLANR